MKTLKSIGAVLAGIIVLAALSSITDTILEKTGIFTPPEQGFFITWMIIVAVIYRCIYQVIGGYVTAALAPANPMKHVAILGIIGTALSIVGIFIAWNLSQHWYPIALAVLAFPTVWLGGKLRTKNS